MEEPTEAQGEAPPSLRVLAEEGLRSGGLRLRFAGSLERRFRRDGGGRRARALRLFSTYGLAAYLAFSVILSVATPGWGFTALQDCGVIILGLLAIPYVRPGVVFWKREAAILLLALGICLSLVAMACEQAPQNALMKLSCTVLPLSLILVVMRPPFPAALLLTALTSAAFYLSLFLEPGWNDAPLAVLVGLEPALVVPSLLALHGLQRASRRLYLHGVLQRLNYQRKAAAQGAAPDLSAIDPLTGAASRRRLEAELQRICDQSETCGSFLLIDIDWFKDFNDMFGHLTGDRCLQEVANCLSGTLRDGDLLGRVGGEEFGILLPSLPMMDGIMVAERLRGAVACYPFMVGTRIAPVTVSIGIAAVIGYDDPARVMATAEQALFRAKQAGRNQVGTPRTKLASGGKEVDFP